MQNYLPNKYFYITVNLCMLLGLILMSFRLKSSIINQTSTANYKKIQASFQKSWSARTSVRYLACTLLNPHQVYLQH